MSTQPRPQSAGIKKLLSFLLFFFFSMKCVLGKCISWVVGQSHNVKTPFSFQSWKER